MALAFCEICALWLGERESCLHIGSAPTFLRWPRDFDGVHHVAGENAEAHRETNPFLCPSDRTDWQETPGALTLLPDRAGQTARGGSFCPPTMGAAAPRFSEPPHSTASSFESR